MVRRGALTPEEAEHHPQRSILTRALGPDSQVEVDVHTHGARDGDLYLICSDGLTTMVRDDSIREALAASDSLHETATELVRRANVNGGADNITVVLLRLTGAGVTSAATAATSDPAAATQIVPAVTPAAAAADTGEHTVVRPAINGEGPPPGADVRAQARARNRRSRRVITIVLAVGVFAIAAAGAALVSLQVYFIGVDDRGMLTVYRGLPYEGPIGFNLYTVKYTSTVPAVRLTSQERARLLDHRLRNQEDALDLMDQVEQGRVAVGGPAG
jgi:protein phosphatase